MYFAVVMHQQFGTPPILSTKDNSLTIKTAHAVIWHAIQHWSERIGALLIFLLLAKLLKPADFGLVAMVSVFLALLGVVVEQGISVTLIQQDEVKQSHLDTAFFAMLCTGCTLFIICLVIAPLVAEMYGEPRLIEIMCWLAPVLPLMSLTGVHVAMLRKELQFKRLVFLRLCSMIIGGVMGVAGALQGYGAFSLVLQQLSAALVAAILIRWVSPLQIKPRLNLQYLCELYSFSTPVFGSRLLNSFNSQTDKLIIGLLLGPAELGIYTLASRLYQTARGMIFDVLGQVALSSFSKIKHSQSQLSASLYESTQLSLALGAPLIISLIVLVPIVLPIVFGEQWLHAGPVFAALALASLTSPFTTFNLRAVTILGKPGWVLAWGGMITLSKTLVCWLAAPYGILAVAYSATARVFLMSPGPFLLARRLVPLSLIINIRRILAVLGSIFIALPLLFFTLEIAEELGILLSNLLAVALFLVAYLIALRYWAPSVINRLHFLLRS